MFEHVWPVQVLTWLMQSLRIQQSECIYLTPIRNWYIRAINQRKHGGAHYYIQRVALIVRFRYRNLQVQSRTDRSPRGRRRVCACEGCFRYAITGTARYCLDVYSTYNWNVYIIWPKWIIASFCYTHAHTRASESMYFTHMNMWCDCVCRESKRAIRTNT